MERVFHVYIMAGESGVLYTGVTSRLANRVSQHKLKFVPGFTRKYNLTEVVWFEPHASVRAAIASEKEIKGWRRNKKVALDRVAEPTMERSEPIPVTFRRPTPSFRTESAEWGIPLRLTLD